MKMISVSDIPEDWKFLLAGVQAFEPAAVIAGGAIRDLDNARAVNDIDIFIPSGGNTRAITDMLREKGYAQTKHFDAGYRNVDHTIEDVSTFEAVGKTAIGIIRMACSLTVMEWLERFDLGLCQIAFNGRSVFATSAYFADKAAEQFTLTRSDTKGQFNRSHSRHKRLAIKYPGWPLVVPAVFSAKFKEAA